MSVYACRSTYRDIYENLGKALESLGYEPSNERVLLKPCLGNDFEITRGAAWTSTEIVKALIRLFPDRQFTVAESVAVGQPFHKILKKNGYMRLASEYPQVEILNLEEAKRREVEWDYGRIELPEVLFSHEYINLPSLHTHIEAGVSLGLKNQKGLLLAKDKKRFHREDLQGMIRSLGEAVKPRMTIVDGIVGAQGQWPLPPATRKRSNLLICGDDNFETDRAACYLMGIDPATIPHVGPGEVRFISEDMKKLVTPYRPAGEKEIVKFVRFNIPMNSCICSGCANMSNEALLRMFLWPRILLLPYTLWRVMEFCLLNRTYIIMGTEPGTPERPCKVICIGDCTKKYARENSYHHIPGCPPALADIVKIFLRASIPTR